MNTQVSGFSDAPAKTRRYSWTSATRVFRSAEPHRREVCGIINAPAALTRIRKGSRRQVRLLVKPQQLEAAVDAVAAAS